ncbi:GNAT family N-acetyltransferase [Oleomonas cavernae]|uniref:GNAT family N-acetyltransferase n=1 Tax=Oleomonas cavernae TaxID=2320859 RepID=A0A418WIK6_9PROT|nr:GNAT family N-acetyltransferase [Oleomonas cavernae]RJF89709.1 GNAT family N-acetyltransferase [Oleomonas cavernae]
MDIEIRPLAEADLAAADRIFRLAFGTFVGLPEPSSFMGDAALIAPRWHADPQATLGAFRDGELVGSNFAANWGSFGFFGPLTIRPDLWDQGIARQLLERTMALFAAWGTRQLGLFTFPDSPKHHGFYGKFGFAVGALTPVMAKRVERADTAPWTTIAARPGSLAACRALAGAVYPGLDLTGEIAAVAAQKLGDTVLVHDGTELVAFAVCHAGAGTEAGSDTVYVKFGAAKPGAADAFDRLLAACEAYAHGLGATALMAGTNAARSRALALMEARGFKVAFEGVAMLRDGAAGYNRAECLVMDDWR